MSINKFLGEMKKLGSGKPTASKNWRGEYEEFESLENHPLHISALRNAVVILKIGSGHLNSQ